jgi:hypothetical protein
MAAALTVHRFMQPVVPQQILQHDGVLPQKMRSSLEAHPASPRGGVFASPSTMLFAPGMNAIGMLVLFAAAPTHGEKAMTDQRPTAGFRAEHREMQEHLGHIRDWGGALPTHVPTNAPRSSVAGSSAPRSSGSIRFPCRLPSTRSAAGDV